MRFHFKNCAMEYDIRTGADLLENSVRQSCGVMVNCLCDLRKISRFHERAPGTTRSLPPSKQVRWPVRRPQTAMAGNENG
ncbi:hypothetical protein [Hoeflea phototrophica]|uniref:hypothetical protein n=1 Tax=Hoeflea phototrophica TaxID=244596 RepID=UPI001AEBE77C